MHLSCRIGGRRLARCSSLPRGRALGPRICSRRIQDAHAGHLSIVSAMVWLPISDAASPDRKPPTRSVVTSLALGAVTALQFLAGHAQMTLLMFLPALAWALYLVLVSPDRLGTLKRLLLPAAGVLLGTILAAPQILTTVQLAGLSQRAGGLDSTFFTSYSFHPFLVATFLSPFLLGNPYPSGSIELMGYVGLIPWPQLDRPEARRRPMRWLLLGLAIAGLLVLWTLEPALWWLERVPP